ncbi:MAG: hypothetical protein EZS28_052486, partial [Streblomastix strix]
PYLSGSKEFLSQHTDLAICYVAANTGSKDWESRRTAKSAYLDEVGVYSIVMFDSFSTTGNLELLNWI